MVDGSAGGQGGFVLSLDFELMWGVNGSRTVADYGANILGVRTVVPRMLELFDRHALGCTWATVGLLFFDDRDALMEALPPIRPNYRDPALSNYTYLKNLGRDEPRDPYHFAGSLVRRIAQAPRQEIATHTFSHYYCLEDGQTSAAFAADLQAARKVADTEKISLRSIVFPRNQVTPEALQVCRAAGLTVYRGNPGSNMHRPVARSAETMMRRGLRLADSYVSLEAQTQTVVSHSSGMTNVPASLFLRPFNRRLAAAEGFKRDRILKAMRRAAQHGELFHLWFHPHNFGTDQAENFALMDAIAKEAADLAERYDWPSLTMAEAAERAFGRQPIGSQTWSRAQGDRHVCSAS